MWELVFYSYVEKICMTTSFHLEVKLWPKNYFNPATFYCSACPKPENWAVMYISSRRIYHFPSVSTILDYNLELFRRSGIFFLF